MRITPRVCTSVLSFTPLLSALISGLFRRKIGARRAGVLSSSCISIGAIISGGIFYEVILNGSPTYLKLFKIMGMI